MNMSHGCDHLKGARGTFAALGTLMLMAIGMSASTAYGNAITDIEFSSKPQSKFEIRLEFEDTPPDPKTYTIESPARISMDFPGVSSSLDRKKFPLPFGNATGVVVLEAVIGPE